MAAELRARRSISMLLVSRQKSATTINELKQDEEVTSLGHIYGYLKKG